jgi:hypothetical protein
MATDDFLPIEKQRNPITQATHKHQAFWQIYFPLILFGAFVLITIILVVFADNAAASKWADISLIFIISLAMVVFLLTMIGTVVIIYYNVRLIKATPYVFFTIQRYAYIMELNVKRASSVAAEPFLRVNSYIAGARALRKK